MKKVILEYNINNLLARDRKAYRKFIICEAGACDFVCNDKHFLLEEGNCALLLTRFLQGAEPTQDFRCQIIYIEEAFLRQSQPNHPYIIQATLSLCLDPILILTEKDQALCKDLFYGFSLRMNDTEHRFYDEILRTSSRMLVLDLFDMHARTHKANSMSRSSSDIMSRFITMLDNKEYRDNREVAYYAKQLYVVPKYLSEVSNKTSGFNASYWINRFTSQEINELLREGRLTTPEIAAMFHFTSVSYFNRYVKRYLGAYPAELRRQ